MNREKIFQSLPDLCHIQKETYAKRKYFYDNSRRLTETGVVLQQTLKGSAFFEDKDGRRQVGPGQVMLFGYAEESSYGLDEKSERPYQLCWVSLTGGEGLFSLVNEIRENFGSVLQMSEKGEAGQLLARLYEDFQKGNFRDRFFMADCTYRLLIALYREQVAGVQGEDPISYGRHLLQTQFRSPRNLKEWVEEIGISREHFTREFHARYGETPASFLRRLRLEHARVLLHNHSLTLPDVASACGFASPQTFCRAFKMHFGMAAGQLR